MAEDLQLARRANGVRFPLRPGRNEVGRSAAAHVCLDDPSVSQLHAILHVHDGRATLRDLGSTNGTRVNGERVEQRVLKAGDEVCFGGVVLVLLGGALPPQGAADSDPPAVDMGGTNRCLASAAHSPVRRRSSGEFRTRYAQLVEAQVTPDATRCVQCGICSYNCPAGIDVRGHARRGRPVVLSQCLTCGECVANCPRGVLAFERNPLFEGIDG